jgi:hypothetical protein
MGDAVKKAIKEVRDAARWVARANPGADGAIALDRYNTALDALVTAARLEGAEAMRDEIAADMRRVPVVQDSVGVKLLRRDAVLVVIDAQNIADGVARRLSPATVVSDAARRAT